VVPGGFVLEDDQPSPAAVTAQQAQPESLDEPFIEQDVEPPAASVLTQNTVPDDPTQDEPPPVIPSPPYILAPTVSVESEDLRMVTVYLRPGSDKVRDNLRLRQAYGILISYPGNDRFALQIYERSRGYRIEFPNFTTAVCPELLARLSALVGADNVIVEKLTIL
jgi:hypothetical protein